MDLVIAYFSWTFVAIMIGTGIYSRRKVKNVQIFIWRKKNGALD